eukprot:2763983-Pyramimonas_sp.AAC.3
MQPSGIAKPSDQRKIDHTDRRCSRGDRAGRGPTFGCTHLAVVNPQHLRFDPSTQGRVSRGGTSIGTRGGFSTVFQ